MGEAGELSGAGEAQREREARFERLGASPELAAYLSTFEEKPRGYGLLLSAQLAVLFAAIALLVLAIRSLAAASETRALTAAADVGAVLYETNFGFSWLPAFVAMIFLWVPAASLVSALLPTRLQHAYFAKGLLDSMNQAWAAAWVRRGFASIPAHYSPEQMIDHVLQIGMEEQRTSKPAERRDSGVPPRSWPNLLSKPSTKLRARKPSRATFFSVAAVSKYDFSG